jgi:cytochrome c553
MIKRGLLIASLATAIMAQTTMCFKKEWQDPSTIETTVMDGGKCAGVNSIEQMKKNGWSIDDIKISSGKNGLDFMYILKKGVVTTLNDTDLEARLNQIQDNREKAKEEAKKKEAALTGEKIYKHHCQSCHGKNGEIESSNTSRKINTMSVDEIKIAFRDYSNNDKDNGMAIIMRPYAGLVFGDDLDAVANYIQTLK